MFNTKQPICYDKSLPFISKSSCVFHKKDYISKILMCSHKTPHFTSKHLNLSNYKTCLYNLFVCLYTKNTKDPPVFFHKTLHFTSKHVNPSNYKTCLYNLFVCLYTKNTKDPPVFFHKNTTFDIKTLKSE